MTDLTPDPEAPAARVAAPAAPCAENVVAVPALADNYLWLKAVGCDRAVAIDPGDATAIESALEARGWSLAAILLTHHHHDHIDGVAALRHHYDVPVYGFEDPRVPANCTVQPGDVVQVDGHRFHVLGLKGHTSSQIGWHDGEDAEAFVGDALFALGCGRLFEGTAAEGWAALSRLMELPPHTRIYAAHEYTMANLAFARWLFPQDVALAAEQNRVFALRAAGLPTLPTVLDRELALNPFLRMRETRWRRSLATHGVPDDAVSAFGCLRAMKDSFR